jgi:uncharacterized protein (DUF58 family)
MDAQDRPVPSFFIIPLTLFLVGGLLFIALLYGQRDLTLLTLLVLGLAGGAKLWAMMSLSGMRCHSAVDGQKVFPGERLVLKMGMENGKFLPVWFRVKVPVGHSLLPPADETDLTKEGSLLWYQKTHFEWELTAKRRGVHQIGPAHIETGDLLAFFFREKKTEESHQVIVFPRLIPLKPLSLPRRDFFGVPGVQGTVQDPIYILGTRDYQPGQPAKTIHWKASARHNRLQEKVFESSEQEKVLLVVEVDQFARSEAEEAFEHTLEAAASLTVRLTGQGYAAGLATNGVIEGGGRGMIPVARNQQQLSALLEVLARLRMKSIGDLLKTLPWGSELPWGLSCVLFTLEEDRATLALKDYFEHLRIPVVFLVCRPHSPSGDGESKIRHRIHRLDDICMKETGRQ